MTEGLRCQRGAWGLVGPLARWVSRLPLNLWFPTEEPGLVLRARKVAWLPPDPTVEIGIGQVLVLRP